MTAVTWSQAPTVAVRRRSDRWREPVAVLVGGVPPAYWMVVSNFWRRGLVLLAIGLVGAALMAVAGARWTVRLAVAAASSVAAAALVGPASGLWLAGALVLADWAVRRRPPLPFLPVASASAVVGAVVLSALAAWRGEDVIGLTGPLVLTALAFVLTLVDGGLGGAVTDGVRTAATMLGRVVVAVEFLVLAVVVVILPWPVTRLVGADRFRAPTLPDSQWVPLGRRDVHASQLWAPGSALLRLRWPERVRRALVPVVSVMALTAFGAVVTVDQEYHEPVPGVFADTAWWPDYLLELSWYMSTSYDPLSVPRLKDATGEFINVQDGVRRTWTPPDCGGCRRVTLWVYGGSTTFGLGQRDDHTISSELARRAWEDGIALDVVNRGIPGDLQWLEAQRFGWDVAAEDPPDLVIFYDGVNEMMGALHLQDLGRPADRYPIDPAIDRIRQRDLATFGYFDDFNPADGPGTATAAPPTTFPRLEAKPLGELAVSSYEIARATSRAVAAQAGVPVRWFWQPSVFTRPITDGDPVTDNDGGRWNREWWAGAIADLPDDVVDLTDVFDDVDGPVFYDEMHHDERGAVVVADALWASVGEQVRGIAGGAG